MGHARETLVWCLPNETRSKTTLESLNMSSASAGWELDTSTLIYQSRPGDIYHVDRVLG